MAIPRDPTSKSNRFLYDHEMRLFVLPLDTTGATQKLDQVNQKIHSAYRDDKTDLFSPFSTINREVFMTILSQAGPKWYTNELLQAAGKRVGITESGLNVNWMQQEMFDRAEQLMAESPEKNDLNLSAASPIGVRRFGAEEVACGEQRFVNVKTMIVVPIEIE